MKTATHTHVIISPLVETTMLRMSDERATGYSRMP